MYFLTPTSEEGRREGRMFQRAKPEQTEHPLPGQGSWQFLPWDYCVFVHALSSEWGCLLWSPFLCFITLSWSDRWKKNCPLAYRPSDHKEPHLNLAERSVCHWEITSTVTGRTFWCVPHGRGLSVSYSWGSEHPGERALAQIGSDPLRSVLSIFRGMKLGHYQLTSLFGFRFIQWQVSSNKMWVQVVFAT